MDSRDPEREAAAQHLVTLMRRVHYVKMRYEVIHNAVLRGSLFTLFRPIDYARHGRVLGNLRSEILDAHAEIVRLRARESALPDEPPSTLRPTLEEYSTSLIALIARLRDICDAFDQKSQGSPHYKWSRYRQDLKPYQAEQRRLRVLGKTLNAIMDAAEPTGHGPVDGPAATERDDREGRGRWKVADTGALKSLARAWRLRRISRRLSRAHGTYGTSGLPSKWPRTTDALLRETGRQDALERRAEEELFALCESVPTAQPVLQHYGANRDKLRDTYRRLLMAGAGQWAGGHYVAASAFAYGVTLEFVLRWFQEPPSRNTDIDVAYRLIEYFRKGETGPIQ
jgi:hypothetical protein